MKVAIAWYGAEGQSSYRYYHERGDEITIVTPKVAEQFPIPSDATLITGEDAFQHLNGYDIVVRSAGVRPDSLQTDAKIWSSTNEFFARCHAPIIGVTGTKGKGTTCSLIASILRAAGKTVHLVGNIGIPALEQLELITSEDVVVFELSSFQLWDLEYSPQTAVILKIEPDHMDVHANMEEYVHAKAQITRYMTSEQRVYYHPTFDYSKQAAQMYNAETRRYAVADDGAAYVADGMFKIGEMTLCSTAVMQIPGEHNVENACAAISAAYEYTQDAEAIERGLASFTGLPHRLKFIREVNGVRYFDDSYSSAPAAAIAAIRAHSDPQVVLLGGYDKGSTFDELALELKNSSVTQAIVYGQTREKIRVALEAAGVERERYNVLDSEDFEEIVHTAVHAATPGGVVVLSPACASFGMFKNFTERGEQFTQIIERL